MLVALLLVVLYLKQACASCGKRDKRELAKLDESRRA